jgi:hypothetical protein
MADIFDLGDLPSWLQVPEVDEQTAIRNRRYANGWLMSATGMSTWPSPIPDNLWAWAIELAAIAHRNPAGAASEKVDDFEVRHDAMRRVQILDEARKSFGGGGQPSYSFPAPDWHWKASGVSSITSD